MPTRMLLVAGLATLGLTATARAQTAPPHRKIAVVDIQSAIMQTKDGQKAVAALKAKFSPTEAALAKLQSDIQLREETYRKGSNAMSEEARGNLAREIDAKRKQLQRNADDAKADLDAEQQKVLQALGGKMDTVLKSYANKNGIVLVLDVSNPQTPVVFVSDTIDITRELIGLFDQAGVAPAAPASSTTGAKTSAPVTKKPGPK